MTPSKRIRECWSGMHPDEYLQWSDLKPILAEIGEILDEHQSRIEDLARQIDRCASRSK